jgi:hypothetical protein
MVANFKALSQHSFQVFDIVDRNERVGLRQGEIGFDLTPSIQGGPTFPLLEIAFDFLSSFVPEYMVLWHAWECLGRYLGLGCQIRPRVLAWNTARVPRMRRPRLLYTTTTYSIKTRAFTTRFSPWLGNRRLIDSSFTTIRSRSNSTLNQLGIDLYSIPNRL